MDQLRIGHARMLALALYGVTLSPLQCDLVLLYFSYGWKTAAAVRAVARNWTGSK
jgi:hypothetical protein